MFSRGQSVVNDWNNKVVIIKDIKSIAGITTYICTKPYDNDDEVHLYEDDIHEIHNGRGF
jgi:hypothetical protein